MIFTIILKRSQNINNNIECKQCFHIHTSSTTIVSYFFLWKTENRSKNKIKIISKVARLEHMVHFSDHKINAGNDDWNLSSRRYWTKIEYQSSVWLLLKETGKRKIAYSIARECNLSTFNNYCEDDWTFFLLLRSHQKVINL